MPVHQPQAGLSRRVQSSPGTSRRGEVSQPALERGEDEQGEEGSCQGKGELSSGRVGEEARLESGDCNRPGAKS